MFFWNNQSSGSLIVQKRRAKQQKSLRQRINQKGLNRIAKIGEATHASVKCFNEKA
jgi:nucleosome binding factor SPN SPT16 subunit